MTHPMLFSRKIFSDRRFTYIPEFTLKSDMANVKHMAIFSAITGTHYSGYAVDEVMGVS